MDNSEWPLPHQLDTHLGRVAYNVMGQGPAVVLVHGTPSTSYLWRHIAPSLARHRTVYVYDLPGFGASELSSSNRPAGLIRTQAEVLAELANAWGLDRPALVGHDIGGGVVMRTHLLHELQTERIGLADAAVVAPWITPRSRELRQRLDEIRRLPVEQFAPLVLDHLGTATTRALPPSVWQRLFGQWDGVAGQRAYLDNLESFDEQDTDDFTPLLPSVAAPVLLLWGEDDRWLPQHMAHRLSDHLPDSTLRTLPDAGHFAMEDQPQGFLAALQAFLTPNAR